MMLRDRNEHFNVGTFDGQKVPKNESKKSQIYDDVKCQLFVDVIQIHDWNTKKRTNDNQNMTHSAHITTPTHSHRHSHRHSALPHHNLSAFSNKKDISEFCFANLFFSVYKDIDCIVFAVFCFFLLVLVCVFK